MNIKYYFEKLSNLYIEFLSVYIFVICGAAGTFVLIGNTIENSNIDITIKNQLYYDIISDLEGPFKISIILLIIYGILISVNYILSRK